MEPSERRVVAVTAWMHGSVHSAILAIPVLLAFAWGPEFGFDSLTLGLLAATAYVGFGLSSVPFGYRADRAGSPRLLLLCATGIVASLAILALSPGLAALAASLAALGLFAGIYHPAGLSLISRALRSPGRGMGWHGLGGSLGIAAGPALVGALLATGWPWRSVVALLAIPAAVSVVLLLTIRLPRVAVAPVNPGLVAAIRGTLRRSFVLVLLVYAFSGLAYWGTLTFLPQLVGAGAFAVLLGLGALGQVTAGYLADRPRYARTLAILTLLAASALLLGVLGSPVVAVPSAFAFGFLLFSLEPLQNTLAASEVPAQQRGVAFGLTFLSVFGIGSLGAVVAGILLNRGDATSLYVVLAGFLALSAVSVLAVTRSRRRAGPDSPRSP